ncbi:unnamed protein product, partial [Discosporangium mesarthrocarpum]
DVAKGLCALLASATAKNGALETVAYVAGQRVRQLQSLLLTRCPPAGPGAKDNAPSASPQVFTARFRDTKERTAQILCPRLN